MPPPPEPSVSDSIAYLQSFLGASDSALDGQGTRRPPPSAPQPLQPPSSLPASFLNSSLQGDPLAGRRRSPPSTISVLSHRSSAQHSTTADTPADRVYAAASPTARTSDVFWQRTDPAAKAPHFSPAAFAHNGSSLLRTENGPAANQADNSASCLNSETASVSSFSAGKKTPSTQLSGAANMFRSGSDSTRKVGGGWRGAYDSSNHNGAAWRAFSSPSSWGQFASLSQQPQRPSSSLSTSPSLPSRERGQLWSEERLPWRRSPAAAAAAATTHHGSSLLWGWGNECGGATPSSPSPYQPSLYASEEHRGGSGPSGYSGPRLPARAAARASRESAYEEVAERETPADRQRRPPLVPSSSAAAPASRMPPMTEPVELTTCHNPEEHAANMRRIAHYLKDYYAREADEWERGVDSLTAEDVAGLAQCFYIDLYRTVRQARRAAGLDTSSFAAEDPLENVIASITTPPPPPQKEEEGRYTRPYSTRPARTPGRQAVPPPPPPPPPPPTPQQQHPQPQHPTPADPNQRGFLYSVAPSVQLREAGSRGKVQPAEAWVRRKVMASPPPPSGGAQTSEVHLVPASQAAPPHPSPARFRAPPSPTLHPMLVQQAQPAAPVSSRVAAPSIVGASRASRSRLPASLSRSSSVSPPRVMHVRELHHFPCSYARVYVPYGVMGYEEDCGFGGPGTWEDVQGILCGPAAYEVLRRYGCPLFASMRGRDYVPYRVYVIIPEFRRVDIPQDAVLLVLDFKQRVDWVLFLLAMQLYLAKDDGDADDEKRCDGPTSTRTTGDTEAAPTASRHARPPVLSYGRALWMLAVQRLQRARALRGLNPFESHVSARQFERPTDESPSRQRRESLLRGEVDTEDESRKNRAEGQAARPRRVPAASAVSATSALSSRTSSPPQYGVQGAPTSRLASPGTGVSAAAAARPLQFVAPSSLCPPPATAPPNAVLRSPRRGRVMDPRLAQRRQQQQPLRRSLQPQQLLEHFQSPPRVPSPAATAAAPRILSNKNNSEGGHNFNYVQMTNGNVQHVTSAVRVGPSQGRRRGPPAASTAAPNQAMQAPQHAAPAPVSSAEERTSPLSAEATSKPRFRWLKRVANTLNSGRRGSASGKHTPAATAEMRSNGVQ